MRIIKDLFRNITEYKALLQTRNEMIRYERARPVLASGLCDGAKYAFCACLCEDAGKGAGKPALILCGDEKESMKTYAALSELGLKCLIYPERDFSFNNVACSHEYEQERIGVLVSVLDNTADCVIASPSAALQYTIPKEKLQKYKRKYSIDDTADLTELSDFLVFCGYNRVTSVDGAGQFSVRGGIIDVFPPGADNPYRAELYGDVIDSLGIFDIISQRRIENSPSVSIYPVREVLPDKHGADRLKTVIRAQIKKVDRDDVKKSLEGELEALDNTAIPDFADKYISVIYDEKETLLDYFDGALVICDSPNAIADRIKGSAKADELTASLMIEHGQINGRYAEYRAPGAALDAFAEKHAAVYLDNFSSGGLRYGGIFTFRTSSPLSYNDSFDLLCDDLQRYINGKWAVLLLCENEAVARSYSDMLYETGAVAPYVSAEKAPSVNELYKAPYIIYPCGAAGFICEQSRFAVISLHRERSMYGKAMVKRRAAKKKQISAKERILSYADLEPGDYIVHDSHGIGVFVGLKTLDGYDGCRRDFLHIKYAENGVLYVPCDRLDSISKYIGAGAQDGTVRLNKMGSADWTKAKAKAKAAAKEMAAELIALYAGRLRRPGIAFSDDDDLQSQFESSFEYEETEGQLEASNDIKRDMCSPHPMDRLLCGDVGFGKTEVALRAAFKAAEDGYQVAVLVPTTILALQHYQTILSRMRGFAVTVDMLSRFRTGKQQAETLRRLKRGDIDIIVGTHRLLSDDVEFKKLGLIIVDEEQRFGVAHKEKLKKISGNADVLTLTATPIPRTLNMAISGIRDMSILDEAPMDRLPPQTYVLEYDDMIISDAIKKELRRGGQVFYLYNNTETIEHCAARLRELCPDASVVTAHGKMDKEELSDIWRDVIDGNIDVLVCTTIIETGVDVPNANTLIIEDADRLGLSQLHQIRGRIGRSNRRSYAYFTYRPYKSLSEIAEKRLSAIREYTEFGSGFKIALRDLEIRGAGDILGAEQHGHIDTVGYDMYIKLLNEAVLEEKGEVVKPVRECTVNLQYSAYIPKNYIKSDNLRIEMYKKISHITSPADLDDVADELLDRFGEFPVLVDNLLYVSLLRALGSSLDVERIDQRDGKIVLTPYEFDAEKWVVITSASKGRLMIYPGKNPTLTFRLKQKENTLHVLCGILSYKE
ncbi:MAG: transcription-repair coupling factor [Clostridia bacterium]|nr:transcription-repair coupling factor [Clostridia bacterium]